MAIIKKKDANELFEMANTYMQKGDLKKAVQLLQEASEQGHVFATTNLGICYYYGDGVAPDINKARELFHKSENSKDSSAIYYLSIISRDEGQYSQSLSYLKEAAELGNPYAQHDLGELFVSGNSVGVSQDIRQAIHWFAYAAQQGHPDANKKFQMLYYNGHETKEAPTGFWFEREQIEGRSIPCSEPFTVTIKDSQYVVPGLRFE